MIKNFLQQPVNRGGGCYNYRGQQLPTDHLYKLTRLKHITMKSSYCSNASRSKKNQITLVRNYTSTHCDSRQCTFPNKHHPTTTLSSESRKKYVRKVRKIWKVPEVRKVQNVCSSTVDFITYYYESIHMLDAICNWQLHSTPSEANKTFSIAQQYCTVLVSVTQYKPTSVLC